jgi:hypothetical protein
MDATNMFTDLKLDFEENGLKFDAQNALDTLVSHDSIAEDALSHALKVNSVLVVDYVI